MAADNSANDGSWANGSNEGSGFGAWTFNSSNDAATNFGGTFPGTSTAGADDIDGLSDVSIRAGGEKTPASRMAVDRLQEYGGFEADVIYGSESVTEGKAGLTIVLGSANESTELQALWERHPTANADSYLIKTVSTEPLLVIASGIDPRGSLFAAYHLADLLRAKTDLFALDLVRSPRIGERYASFGATTHGRRNYDPDLHWKTLNELPSFGYNGIIIYPGGGTPIGRRTSPVAETKAGDLSLDPENTKKWKAWFSELENYHLDLMMTVPPVIPPGYANREIKDFYAGGPEPKGYIPALKSHFRHFLQLITEGYPEIDKYMFNSTEGATFGRNVRFFGHPDTRFTNENYLRNNEKVMAAYFDVLTEFFKSDLSRVYFWTHSFGLTSEGIAKVREVLFRYPEVTIIEDDFWNNNLWPFGLPVMAYLPEDLREQVFTKNPFALFQIAPEGEYFGGGSLPNTYPDSHIGSAKEAVERGARMVIHRLDLHDRTPYGTAFGTMELVPYAASKQLWEPTPSTREIWREWADSRFGREAAPWVIRALQESETVILKGLSCNGIDLLCVGSEFAPRLWARDGSGVTRFYLFGKPGRRLVSKGSDDVIFSGEYTAYQMETHSISIEEFHENQKQARAAVQRGLDQIERAKLYLAPADYEMLNDIFVNGKNVLKALRLLGEATYATNIILDNFDGVPDPRAAFGRAIAELEAYLAEEKLIPEMTENLARIIEGYKEVANSAGPPL